MADMITQKDIASLVTPRLASPFAALAAGAASNAAAVLGPAIQRTPLGLPRSAALVLAFTATLAAGKTLSLGQVQIQDSADGATWTTSATYTDPGVVATGPANGGTVNGQLELRAQMGGARDFVRVAFTPTLNAAGTDTASVVALMLLAGFSRLPAPG